MDERPPVAHPFALSTDTIVERLTSPVGRQTDLPDDPQRAAVLVVLADDVDGNAGVLLTRRSRQMRNHSGEISFPGGRLDPGETAEQAALREAWEEVALEPSTVHVVGSLDHLARPASHSYIVPIVGWIDRQLPLEPASIEAERVLWLPLGELVRPDTFGVERWGSPPSSRQLYFFHLDDETVWGITASILVDLLRRI